MRFRCHLVLVEYIILFSRVFSSVILLRGNTPPLISAQLKQHVFPALILLKFKYFRTKGIPLNPWVSLGDMSSYPFTVVLTSLLISVPLTLENNHFLDALDSSTLILTILNIVFVVLVIFTIFQNIAIFAIDNAATIASVFSAG